MTAIRLPGFRYSIIGNGNDETAGIQAVLDAAAASTHGGVNGASVELSGGKAAVANLTIDTRVSLFGQGPATVLGLKAGSTGCVLKTKNFDTLTGTGTFGGPYDFAIRRLNIDGNKTNASSGDSQGALKIYGSEYQLDHVVVKNHAGAGGYSEWCRNSGFVSGSTGMEARIDRCSFVSNNGRGLNFIGPHDSIIRDTHAALNTGSSNIDINATTGSWAIGTKLMGCHVYGDRGSGRQTTYGFLLHAGLHELSDCTGEGSISAEFNNNSSDNQYMNCVSFDPNLGATADIGFWLQGGGACAVRGFKASNHAGAFALQWDSAGTGNSVDMIIFQGSGTTVGGSKISGGDLTDKTSHLQVVNSGAATIGLNHRLYLPGRTLAGDGYP